MFDLTVHIPAQISVVMDAIHFMEFLFADYSDPRASGTRAIQPAEDVCTRIRNFDNLVRSIKSFYEVRSIKVGGRRT